MCFNDKIVFFQFTRAEVHAISLEQLYRDLQVARKLKPRQLKFRFYFVVPPHRFRTFTAQALSLKDDKAKGANAKCEEVTKFIEQWVVELKTAA